MYVQYYQYFHETCHDIQSITEHHPILTRTPENDHASTGLADKMVKEFLYFRDLAQRRKRIMDRCHGWSSRSTRSCCLIPCRCSNMACWKNGHLPVIFLSKRSFIKDSSTAMFDYQRIFSNIGHAKQLK